MHRGISFQTKMGKASSCWTHSCTQWNRGECKHTFELHLHEPNHGRRIILKSLNFMDMLIGCFACERTFQILPWFFYIVGAATLLY